MKKLSIIALCLLSGSLWAQSKKQKDREAIKSMCGCYEVRFNFAETFSPLPDYEFHDNYSSGALEWVELVEDEKDKISMQHLLIVGNGQIVKHWRQDWIYENTQLYSFMGNSTWQRQVLDKKAVKGQWTQKVFQVDDSPRYEGTATWIHQDGRHYWEASSYSPLPRREFSKRNDYNVMLRVNRHELTSNGWIHEQDNDKILRSAEGDKLLAQEKGWNTYQKVADEKCVAARQWWAKNQLYWKEVRTVWEEVYAENSVLTIATRQNDGLLFEKIFALGDQVMEQDTFNIQEIRAQVKSLISSHKSEGQ